MQRPKRPGRYPDHIWKIDDWEDYTRPGTPTPDIPRPHRRERYDKRYDPRESKRVVIKYSSRNVRNNEQWAWSAGGDDWRIDSLFRPISTQPPRPRSPPPPSTSHPAPNEPIPGPSTSSSNPVSSSSSTDSKNEVMSRLLSVLECPVCFEYVSPPILQCREGHLVCSGCRARLDLCPKCRQPFADIRARALEQVAEVVPYPCYNSGCGALLPLAERQAHEQVCPYRQHPCTIEFCVWIGKRAALPQHMEQDHPDCLVRNPSHEISLTLTQHVNEEKVFLMQCYDELFHCVMAVDCQQDIFVGFVMYLGPREKASDFVFELQFKREGPPFTSVSIVRTVLEESSTGTSVGISGGINAVVISFSTLREVIQDTNGRSPVLPVKIFVRKKQHETDTKFRLQTELSTSPNST